MNDGQFTTNRFYHIQFNYNNVIKKEMYNLVIQSILVEVDVEKLIGCKVICILMFSPGDVPPGGASVMWAPHIGGADCMAEMHLCEEIILSMSKQDQVQKPCSLILTGDTCERRPIFQDTRTHYGCS